jgi:hypothetical protein
VVVNVAGSVLSRWGLVEDVTCCGSTRTAALWPSANEATMSTAASDSDVNVSRRFTATSS